MQITPYMYTLQMSDWETNASWEVYSYTKFTGDEFKAHLRECAKLITDELYVQAQDSEGEEITISDFTFMMDVIAKLCEIHKEYFIMKSEGIVSIRGDSNLFTLTYRDARFPRHWLQDTIDESIREILNDEAYSTLEKIAALNLEKSAKDIT